MNLSVDNLWITTVLAVDYAGTISRLFYVLPVDSVDNSGDNLSPAGFAVDRPVEKGFPVSFTSIDRSRQDVLTVGDGRRSVRVSEKDRLRQEMLAKRASLTTAESAFAAETAAGRLLDLLHGRRVVMLYSAFRGELDAWPAARQLEALGCTVALPITDRKEKRLTPAQLQGIDSLVQGAYGILEPAAGHYTVLAPEQLEAVVVPGVCFDLTGYRIGYGGGYYDRFLPRLAAGCLTIGYGYDWQVVPGLTSDPWDQPLSHVVTERRTIDCKVVQR